MKKATTVTIRIDDSIKQRLIDASNDRICHVSDLVRIGIDHVLGEG